jgi:hypothetical protein
VRLWFPYDGRDLTVHEAIDKPVRVTFHENGKKEVIESAWIYPASYWPSKEQVFLLIQGEDGFYSEGISIKIGSLRRIEETTPRPRKTRHGAGPTRIDRSITAAHAPAAHGQGA